MMKKTALNFAFLMLTALLAVTPAAYAQSGSFIVSQNGKPVGTASFNFIATPSGYDSTALVHVAMQGLNYALSKTERLSSANRLRHVQLSAIVNGSAINVTAAPDSAQIQLNISANGRAARTTQTVRPCWMTGTARYSMSALRVRLNRSEGSSRP